MNQSLTAHYQAPLIQLENGHKGALGHLNGAYLAHALLTFLLLFKEFALAGDVAAVTLGRHILAHLTYGFTCNDFCADGCLHGNVKLLAGNQILELEAYLSAEVIGVILVNEGT